MNRKPIIKKHGIKLSEVKRGTIYMDGKKAEFRIVKSLGRKFFLLEDDAIGFNSFEELFAELRRRGISVIINGHDKYGKGSVTIVL